MSRFPSRLFEDSRAYARSKAPWQIDAMPDENKDEENKKSSKWKLFHYLSGGGSKAFGRTMAQEEADIKRTRFLIVAGVIALLWLFFWV